MVIMTTQPPNEGSSWQIMLAMLRIAHSRLRSSTQARPSGDGGFLGGVVQALPYVAPTVADIATAYAGKIKS